MRKFILPSEERRGFTLIELLVVIAIIAILAAILFPVFAKARENARKSNCQSNMKQLGLAFRSYSQDYDETMPGINFDANGSGTYGDTGDYTWRTAVVSYIKNVQVMQCPSKKLTTTFTTSVPLDYGYNAGYGMNNVHWATGNPVGPSWQADASIVVPSETVLLGETDGPDSFSNDGSNVHLSAGGTAWATTASGANYRHADGSNFLFCDGHVKWFKPDSVKCQNGNCQFSISGS